MRCAACSLCEVPPLSTSAALHASFIALPGYIYTQDTTRSAELLCTLIDSLQSRCCTGAQLFSFFWHSLEHVSLPKLRAMYAMRACRSSIMVGTALDAPQMSRLVRGLQHVEHPWSCPHGRPTLRHLADVTAAAAGAAAAAAAAAQAQARATAELQ